MAGEEPENHYPTEWKDLVDEDYEVAKDIILEQNKDVGIIERIQDGEKPFEFRRPHATMLLKVRIHVKAGLVTEPYPRVEKET
ncbi:hypothetical protein ACP4OV_030821 [Aristida adscensionis]